MAEKSTIQKPLFKKCHCIFQELIENSVLPKPKKMSASDHEALTKLLVEKDKQLKHTMVVSRLRRFCAQIYSYLLINPPHFLFNQLAMKQGQIESNIQELTVQVKKHDEAIKDLQKKFKDAETLLATAIFQVSETSHHSCFSPANTYFHRPSRSWTQSGGPKSHP